ncbi:MAG: hypothetical protein ACFHXK_08060 [bacterium]
MAYPVEADLETAIAAVEAALLENRTIPNAESAWNSWQEVVAHLIVKVSPDASYGALARTTAEFGDV